MVLCVCALVARARGSSLDVDTASVSYVDNTPCLDLVEKGTTSIFAMCDEEIKMPKASDEHLLERLHAQHHKNTYYVKPKLAKVSTKQTVDKRKGRGGKYKN